MAYRQLAPAIVLLVSACTTVHYPAPCVNVSHQVLAVLPSEMILTGKLPDDVSARKLRQIEETESQIFQGSLYDALLGNVGVGSACVVTRYQPIEKTNRLLRDAGIDIRQSWSADPEALAKILEVDGLVRARIIKTRYLSDATSYGIEAGSLAVDTVTEGRIAWALPYGLSKTHDIRAECSLYDGYDGTVTWRSVVESETNWRVPANELIRDLHYQIASEFPY